MPLESSEPFSRLKQQEGQVAYWHAQEKSVQRERRQLRYVPIVGVGLALLCFGVLGRLFEALCLLALGITIGLMGLYMTAVRLDEFGDRRREAEQELARVQREQMPHI